MYRFDKNLKALRIAFGMTQEELADKLHFSKNVIGHYENNRRRPDEQKMKSFSEFFGISVSALLYGDYSSMDKFAITVNDPISLIKNVDTIFPILSSEKAYKNTSFKLAHEYHVALYKGLNNVNAIGNKQVDLIIENYKKAYKDELAKVESAANLISIMFLIMASLTTPQKFYKESYFLSLLNSKGIKVEKPTSNELEEVDELIKELKLGAFDYFSEMISVLKHSKIYSDLADYYLALRYIVGLIDNNLDNETNGMIGLEMLGSFAMVGNIYSLNFYDYLDELLLISPQNVDDK